MIRRHIASQSTRGHAASRRRSRHLSITPRIDGRRPAVRLGDATEAGIIKTGHRTGQHPGIPTYGRVDFESAVNPAAEGIDFTIERGSIGLTTAGTSTSRRVSDEATEVTVTEVSDTELPTELSVRSYNAAAFEATTTGPPAAEGPPTYGGS